MSQIGNAQNGLAHAALDIAALDFTKGAFGYFGTVGPIGDGRSERRGAAIPVRCNP